MSNMPHLLDKNEVWEPISGIKNGKTAWPSNLVSQMVKATGEAWVDIITEMITGVGMIPSNQIIVDGIILPEWKL